jgi:hypothetical protein
VLCIRVKTANERIETMAKKVITLLVYVALAITLENLLPGLSLALLPLGAAALAAGGKK